MTDRNDPPAPDAMAASGRGRWIGLAMLSVGVAMIIVDATIVNVAVPSIIRDLNLDSTQAEWINTIYALVFAALLITVGRLGDVHGRRRSYLIGLTVFVMASMLAGLAPNGTILIFARVLQGIGGAMILPATQAILNSNFQGRDRAIAFGIWGSVIGGVAAVGPLLGGFLTTYLSWRWAFFINLPVGLIAIAGTLHYIGESKEEGARSGFDLPGFLLITSGLGLFVFGLIEGRQYGWWAPNPRHPFQIAGWTWPSETISVIPFILGIGIAALILFAIVETRRRTAGKFYLFDFTLWRYRGFRFGNLAGTIVSLGEFGLLFTLPLFLQAVIGLSAFQVGLTILALAVGAFFAAPMSAPLSNRFGPRRVVTLGMALEAIGIFITTLLLSRDLNVLVLVPPLFVYGLGVGFASAQLTSLILGDVPPEVSGLASGTNSMLRQVGSALGIAILGSALFVSLGVGTGERLAKIEGMPPAAQIAVRQAIEGSAGQALIGFRNGQVDPAVARQFGSQLDPATLAQLGKVVTPPIEDAFVNAARTAGFAATAFVLLGLLFSLLIPVSKLHRGESDEEPESGKVATAAAE